MENLARREYDREVDEKIKEELQIACIPVFELPSWMNSEVTTRYRIVPAVIKEVKEFVNSVNFPIIPPPFLYNIKGSKNTETRGASRDLFDYAHQQLSFG